MYISILLKQISGIYKVIVTGTNSECKGINTQLGILGLDIPSLYFQWLRITDERLERNQQVLKFWMEHWY